MKNLTLSFIFTFFLVLANPSSCFAQEELPNPEETTASNTLQTTEFRQKYHSIRIRPLALGFGIFGLELERRFARFSFGLTGHYFKNFDSGKNSSIQVTAIGFKGLYQLAPETARHFPITSLFFTADWVRIKRPNTSDFTTHYAEGTIRTWSITWLMSYQWNWNNFLTARLGTGIVYTPNSKEKISIGNSQTKTIGYAETFAPAIDFTVGIIL